MFVPTLVLAGIVFFGFIAIWILGILADSSLDQTIQDISKFRN